MYLPSHFEETRRDVLAALVASQPLGTLVTQDLSGALQADPIPFVLDPDPAPHGTLRGHVARANPLWRETRADVDALVVFHGAQGYVSPNWYPSKAEHGKAVPTWNYIVVQARGRLRAIDDREWLRDFVTRLTERYEARQTKPWHVSDAPADYLEAMLGAIVGIEIELAALVGKWKASQNRSAADRAGVVAGLTALAARDADAPAAALAAAMGAPAGG
ncbi:MAG TPA: FMN-binding negative transcriptional regulator [Burkholderiaceae bacterium]|jgi:transcriptional regulator|nr:FMN-binding negative transcriptional regulator [Burkholderiaceae bacterium]